MAGFFRKTVAVPGGTGGRIADSAGTDNDRTGRNKGAVFQADTGEPAAF